MSQHETTAWWSLGSGILIWLFLLMRFTEDGRILDLPAGEALAAYIQMIVLWVVAPLFTLFTVQLGSQERLPPLLGQYPRTTRHRRLVSHMLAMTAAQVGHPMAFVVLVIPDNSLLHTGLSMLHAVLVN